MAESKRILEARLGREVAALAYPYGWPGSYTARTKALAAEAGYRLAFASLEGVNRPDGLDPYDIRRLGVGSGDSPALLRARTALHAAFGGHSCRRRPHTRVMSTTSGRQRKRTGGVMVPTPRLTKTWQHGPWTSPWRYFWP